MPADAISKARCPRVTPLQGWEERRERDGEGEEGGREAEPGSGQLREPMEEDGGIPVPGLIPTPPSRAGGRKAAWGARSGAHQHQHCHQQCHCGDWVTRAMGDKGHG